MRYLIHKYEFNEASGDFFDQQGGGDAVVTGAALTRTAADINNGIYFNSPSGSDKVSIVSDRESYFAHVDWSIYFRFKCSPKSSIQTLVAKGRVGTGALNWNCGIVSSADGSNPNKLYFTIQDYDNTNDTVYSTTTITDNVWHDVLVKKNGSLISIYIDSSTADNSKTFSTVTPERSNDETTICCAENTGTYYDHFTAGILSKYYVFCAPLSSSEITNLFTYGTTDTPDASLIHEWSLEERGAVSLFSVDRLGTSNGDPDGSGPDNAAGRFYRGRSFTATTQRLNCGNPTNLQHTTGAFSFRIWFKATATSTSDRYLFAKIASGQIAYGLRIEASTDATNPNGLTFVTSSDGSAETLVTDATNVCDSAWHSAVITKSTTTGTIYLDGTSVASDTIPATLHNSTADFVIGNTDDYNVGALNCVLNYLSAFNTAIGATAAYNLHYHHFLAKPDLPTHEWLFNQTNDTRKIDTGYSLDRAHIDSYVDGDNVRQVSAVGGPGYVVGLNSGTTRFFAPVVADLSPTTEDFSVIWGGWLPPDQLSLWVPGTFWCRWGGAGSRSWYLGLDDNSRMVMYLSSDGTTINTNAYVDYRTLGGAFRSDTYSIQPKYNQIALTRSGTSFKVYVNGILLNEVTGIATLYNPANVNFAINAQYGLTNKGISDNGYAGALDYVQFYYDRVLTAGEVLQKYYGINETYLDNLSPDDGDIEQDLDVTISLSIKDDIRTVTQSSIVITIDGDTAYTGSAFQSGFSGTATADGDGGFDFVINHTANFTVAQSVTVSVTASDDAGLPFSDSYTFDVLSDVTAPYIDNLDPASASTGNRVDVSVDLDILDADSNVSQNSIIVTIDGDTAYSSSSFQSGFSGTITANGTGWSLSIIPDNDFTYNTDIFVTVYAEDSGANAVNTSYTFKTETAHPVKYNIYYKQAHAKEWILANANPLTHDILYNAYTITGLEPNAIYHISVIAGTETSGTFVPLIEQSVAPSSEGASNINRVGNLPYYIVKTFSP